MSASFDDYFNDDWSLPIEMVTHIQPNFVGLNSVRHVKNSKIYKYVGKSPDERQRLWENVVRESFRGEAFLFVDKPPVGDPAADSNAPVQLAEQMVKLFDEAQEEVIILSAYLIPSIDEDWLFMHLPIENEM